MAGKKTENGAGTQGVFFVLSSLRIVAVPNI